MPGEYENLDRKALEAGIAADIALGDLRPEEAPLARIVDPLRKAHERSLRRIQHELEKHEKSRRQAAKYKEHRPDDERTGEQSEKDRLLDLQYDRNQTERSAQLARDLAVAERMKAMLATDPASVLLPLGTLVRTRVPVLLAGDWPLPVEGSLGVISGYSTLANRPNVVSFVERITDTGGQAWRFDDERPHHVNYLPEELEVVENGRLVDGTTVDTPGWTPTHAHNLPGEILYSESMVVAGGGHLWRIQPCSSLPELTQTTTDDDAGRIRFGFLKPIAR